MVYRMSENIVEKKILESSIFSCPHCKKELFDNECKKCGSCNNYEGIPLLVKDYDLIKNQITDAKESGRKDWYEASQDEVWKGPYRHHLLKRQKYVKSILTKYAPEKLLDLGCGDGANLSWLKSYAQKLYGSDYNILRLQRAKKRQVASEVVLADVTDYPAKENTFDTIFFNHVLEHISNDMGALKEVHRILKKGGICILGVPNEGALWWQLAYKFQPNTRETTDHVHFYTVSSLSKKLKDCGFTIKEVKRLGWGLPHWDYDARIRGYKIMDDLLSFFGRIFIPNQASSLYFIIEK